MARIEIQDDWGKPQFIIDIGSSDAGELARNVLDTLDTLDYQRCPFCEKYWHSSYMNQIDRDADEVACIDCHTPQNSGPPTQPTQGA